MDVRGQSRGAPVDALEMPEIDKEIAETWTSHHQISEQPRKNKLLFLTVEYVEDATRDFSRMFPSFEQGISFSSSAASPLSDFEHRVSPLDPNMSSAARYSPTPVQMPPSPFHSSVVVLQDPPSPLITTNDTNIRENINFTANMSDQNNSEMSASSEDPEDPFPNNENVESLVSDVEADLILMQGANPELEAAAVPLMLTEIQNADFGLGRDFLVMQDDQINAFKNSQLTSSENGKENLIGNGAVKIKADAEGVVAEETKADNNLDDSDKKPLRRSKRHINDKKAFWCNECESNYSDADGCLTHNVRTIADQPVPSRAIATLPGSYLSLNKLPASAVMDGGLEYGVFAKRSICKRTQFGPIEGIMQDYSGEPFKNTLPLLLETAEGGKFINIDVSDENSSNWMRFVRPAMTSKEQNLEICQQNDGIVFLTTRNILPKEELKAAPNPAYAARRELPLLQPEKHKAQVSNEAETWPCFECDLHFTSSEILEKHLSTHDDAKNDSPSRNKRKKIHLSSNKLLKVVDGQSNLFYSCPYCPKVFPRNYSLKRHLMIHPAAKGSRPEAQNCGESLLHPYNRSRHMKVLNNASAKEKENNQGSLKEWSCPSCVLVFDRATLFELHTLFHKTKANEAEDMAQPVACPQCELEFDRQCDLVAHVAKHARLKAPKTNNAMSLTTYKCSMCYKRFATKVRLQQHCLVHGAEDQKPLPCEICFKRFMNNSALSCHLKTHREDKQIFECPMCKQIFDQVLLLKEHIETHRNSDETFTCPHCQRSFAKYSVIRKHIRAHHCERKHSCQFCAKRFPSVDKLRMHLLRHSDHREFHCANCGKRFKRKDKLKEHMTRMHNSQKANQAQVKNKNRVKKFVPKVNPSDYNRFVYKCHRCLVGFKRRGMLVNHLAKRHPDVSPESVPELNLPILRQTRDYFCQYCDKVYKSSSKRKAHIVKNHPGAALPPSNRHREEIPGLPNPTFSQAVGSVKTTPQSCQWCHKQYASKAKLLQHQRKKHPNLMEPADQVPRPRNRPPQNQNQPPASNDSSFTMSDYIETCNIDSDLMFKPRVVRITSDVDIVNGEFEMVGQQFIRMRDIR